MSQGQRWPVFVFPNRAETEWELNKAQRSPRMHAYSSQKQTLCEKKKKKSLLNYSWFFMSIQYFIQFYLPTITPSGVWQLMAHSMVRPWQKNAWSFLYLHQTDCKTTSSSSLSVCRWYSCPCFHIVVEVFFTWRKRDLRKALSLVTVKDQKVVFKLQPALTMTGSEMLLAYGCHKKHTLI